MRKAWMLGVLLVVAGCSEKLEGTTWKGRFEKDAVTIAFTSKENVRFTWTREWSGAPVSTTSDMTYTIDGKTIYFKGSKITAKAEMQNGEMIGKPVDFGFENLDSNARVVVRRQN